LEIKEADEDKKETTVLFFNLHDIEPSSLKATEPTGSFGLLEKKTWHHNEPSADVHFETTDNAETMVLVYPYSDHPTKRYKKHVCCDVIGSGIAMKPEYAARFVKALRHAVELCGGKASVF
jgi:hypothetical protein